jgi:hypothetical protein
LLLFLDPGTGIRDPGSATLFYMVPIFVGTSQKATVVWLSNRMLHVLCRIFMPLHICLEGIGVFIFRCHLRIIEFVQALLKYISFRYTCFIVAPVRR